MGQRCPRAARPRNSPRSRRSGKSSRAPGSRRDRRPWAQERGRTDDSCIAVPGHRPGRPIQEVPMKVVRWIAAAALTLISLMDVGSALGGGGHSAAVRVLAPLLGLLGLAAVYGMLRWRPWGAPAALAASAVNVVSALIAMAVSSAGALAGLAVSLIALLLTAAGPRASQTRQPHAPAS